MEVVMKKKKNNEEPVSPIIQIKDQFYVLATSTLADERIRVLKHGETFAVFDRHGDIQPLGLGAHGLYHEGTRHISCLKLSFGKDQPLLLSSTVKDDNVFMAVDMTNPDLFDNSNAMIPQETLHIFRTTFLLHGVCYQRIRIANFGRVSLDLDLSLQFDADFSDIFEVRGTKRKRKGRKLEALINEGKVILSYEGLDNVIRRTSLEFSPSPAELTPTAVFFRASLSPKDEINIYVTISCESPEVVPLPLSYRKAYVRAANELMESREKDCVIYTSNEQFNDWINRSKADLHLMITQTPSGPYPYAGIPWFSTAFGRDGIITAREFLWVNPEIARGVLAYLAATQATDVISERDAEPGKILHETRKGEMATLKEIPFQRYYGTVDATPLFIELAGAYYERTGDRAFIETIWPNIELALEWIDCYGDLDGDGFVEFSRRSPTGLVNQGWKDSWDSIFHSDGTFAKGPIALCEVQGYVYEAKRRAAEMASVLGNTEKAVELLNQAHALQERFEEAFWRDEISSYAIALDGKKRPCVIKSSNVGHCLYTSIAIPEHARRTAETLLSTSMFSGWGIRTLADSEPRYNPMSYHNGSIWPHDNALIAHGLSLYGFKEFSLKLLTGLFDASIFLDLHRLPELFCGFARRQREGPTLYPVACSPQSWSTAAVFLLLQSCLGLSIKGAEAQISFDHPFLPEFLQQVQIKNLSIGTASLDLSIERHEEDVGINILRKEGDIKLVVVK